ncbi:type VII toxin-antitoxin system HepT family RNase toxin [Lysinibacillus piscis]|uniref:DUF86 domain-containing protein n=1 Tax=Lysinibacillus piscis TaxID=2518931 RepID=A0ABQ5NLN8_9BACI|nr:DUF86 domain-containing protein [Lysinibacillus sp. KH24]GLC89278.1 hypothetical protein LYSBPC_24050 [Lysinibacillus sp. KH24]
MKDVILNKSATIELCLKQIHEIYQGNIGNLADCTKQDSIILTIQCACEASIHLAMYIVSEQQLGIPKASRDGFKLLQEAGVMEENLAQAMMNMIGFRHYYQALELDILEIILDKHMENFKAFIKAILQFEETREWRKQQARL